MNPEHYASTGQLLKLLLSFAWLAPLAGFAIEIFAGSWSTRRSKAAAYLAIACIFLGFCASTTAFCVWGNYTEWKALAPDERHHVAADATTPVTGASHKEGA